MPSFSCCRGYTACCIDTCFDCRNDLSSPQGCWDAEQLAEDCDLLTIELDCRTWSLSRRAPIGSRLPRRLRRKGKSIWGIPGLCRSDRLLLHAANRQVRSAIKMIRVSLHNGGMGFLENPAGSLIWGLLFRTFYRELLQGLLYVVSCTMCGYGTKWKKPTRFLVWGPNAHRITLRKCCGRKICDFTKEPHEQLSSNSAVLTDNTGGTKCFATKKGQVYTNKLVSELMTQLITKQES